MVRNQLRRNLKYNFGAPPKVFKKKKKHDTKKLFAGKVLHNTPPSY
jgi:hypothetical protein